MPDLLVTENVAGAEMDALRSAFEVTWEPELWKSPEKIKQIIGNYRGILVRNQTPVTADLIAAGKKLEVIGRAGVGLDNVDANAATQAGIVVAFTPVQNSISVAELVIGLMLTLARQIALADQSTKGGKWERQKFTGLELYEKTIGIVGFGRIGQLVAERVKAFGTRIMAFDVMQPKTALDVKFAPLDDVLGSADVISVHIPKTPQTVDFFDYSKFSKMKPSALFINTSRGEVVKEEDLIRALREKKIAGAALDVRATEPPEKSAMEQMENVILTPHIAAFTREGQKRVVSSICQDVAAVLRGEDAKYFVNFPRPRRSAHS
ncbi:MAG TPA: hydroxyacid dehydrogenase [Tepidisphaeraceae bacterium]